MEDNAGDIAAGILILGLFLLASWLVFGCILNMGAGFLTVLFSIGFLRLWGHFMYCGLEKLTKRLAAQKPSKRVGDGPNLPTGRV